MDFPLNLRRRKWSSDKWRNKVFSLLLGEKNLYLSRNHSQIYNKITDQTCILLRKRVSMTFLKFGYTENTYKRFSFFQKIVSLNGRKFCTEFCNNTLSNSSKCSQST